MTYYEDNGKNKSEIVDLRKQLTDIIESDNNKKLQIKDLEIKNSELSKKNFEFQSHLQNLIIKMNLIAQENSTLKLEIKKLQLSVNSPGKIIASLGTANKGDLTLDNLLKEKSELKETNEKLVLVLSERESELSKIKFDYESQINDLNNIITGQKGKINDLNNDMNDIQKQLNEKEKELMKINEEKNSPNYKKLKIDYDLLQQKYEKQNLLFENLEQKCNLYENENKQLNERVLKIEKSFTDLVNNKDAKLKDIADLELYTNISENLRMQVVEINDSKEKMEQKYSETNLKNKKNYQALEDKYLELFEKNNELQKTVDESQNSFINGTMKLNTEISDLNDKIQLIQKEKDEFKNKYQNLLKELEKNSKNFQNLQNIMTRLREKDDIDITLIEERYIVLENVLELEKKEIINTNRELLNKLKILTEQNGGAISAPQNNVISSKNIDDNNLKLELKNTNEENKMLKTKIKEQEKRLFQLQKKTDILNIIKEENQTLKNNLNENNANLQVRINELTNKTNQLNEELLESRKRTSLLRSKPNFEKGDIQTKIDNQNLSLEIEKYQKEIESLKNELSTQKQKTDEEIESLANELSTLKTQNAADTFDKDNEIMKCKALIKKYKDLLEANGLLKKK